MRETANILSFGDARSSRSSVSTRRPPRTSSSQSSSSPRVRSARGSSRLNDRRGNDDSLRADVQRADARRRGENREEEQQAGFVAQLVKKANNWKRARAKSRADKAFDRQFQPRPSDASQAGPRAALYKGEMGATQKRAARMQNASLSGAVGAAFSGVGAISGAVSGIAHAVASSRKLTVAFVAAVCVAITCGMLYEPAQLYYHSVREQAQLQAELEAVEARNAQLESTVNHLQTDAGVEQAARDQLGWVLPGENSVYVQGLEGTTEEGTPSTAGSIVPGSVEAPETWYSPILDAIFGAE